MFDELRMFLRFAGGLKAFLQTPLSPAECRTMIEQSVREREQNFLMLLRDAVFGYRKSPYLALMKWAGVEYGDIDGMVTRDGVEAALERLFDAGIHISLEEAKGRRPIERRGLTLQVTEGDFINPLPAADFEVQTGGSTGSRKRIGVNLDTLGYEAACKYLLHEAHGLEARPFVNYRAVPPGSAGLKNALTSAKIGHPMARWFTPVPISWMPAGFKSALFTACAVQAGRLWGGSIPAPEYVPPEDVRPIAVWLQEKARHGSPALVSAPANQAARICIAAKDGGFDIAGTVFRVGGEPFTPAKQRLLEEVGARSISSWSMAEAGNLGGGCAARVEPDEVHLYLGKLAAFQRTRTLMDGESQVSALYLTTLLTSSRTVMINLDTGDYGVLSRRRCGCALGRLGLDVHLHTIRSYEKLTTAGMHFLGGDFLTLVEEVLPKRHGGLPTDYQFVEEESETITRVSIIVNPRAGEVDEQAVRETVLDFLGARSRGDRAMAQQWRDAKVLQVVRAEPYTSPAGKVPPLRIIRNQNATTNPSSSGR